MTDLNFTCRLYHVVLSAIKFAKRSLQRYERSCHDQPTSNPRDSTSANHWRRSPDAQLLNTRHVIGQWHIIVVTVAQTPNTEIMAQVEMPFGEAFQSNDNAPRSAPRYPQEASVELLPNPDFVFPMRQPTATGDGMLSTSAPSPRPMSMHTFPRSQHGPAERGQRRTRSTLPNFTFNPADASNSSTSLSTPPHSPLPTSPTTPSRPMGHRRGGSEFIGDSKKDGTATLLSSSPTKSDMAIPTEGSARLGPPTGRRGHAHRRSAAISSHDLSSILQPKDTNAAPRADSAPATPMEINTNSSPQHAPNRSMSFPSPSRSASVDESALFQRDMDSSPRRSSSRARVGFSERVEYIRPLSTISSETESSMSTARGQHSATGSLSSMVSLGAASPPSARNMRPSLDTTPEHSHPETRPGTAGAIMDSSPERHIFGSDLDALRRPVSAHALKTGLRSGSPPAAAARKSRSFWPEHRHHAANPAHALHSSVSEPSLPQALKSSPPPSPTDSHLHPYKDEDDAHSDGRKSRKPRKIRSWATSLVSRKTKSRSPVSSRSTSGSSDAAATASDASEMAAEPSVPANLDLDAAFDADNTVTLLSPKESEIPIPKGPVAPVDASNRPPTAPEPESKGGIIDLDAAFGSFSTQDFAPGSPSRRSGMRGGVRKTLHSGSFSGGPSGMSLSKHKRAESAPELVPFYHRSAAMASTSTMENVFEEDEEDAEGEADQKANSGCEDTKPIAEEEQTPNIGIQVVEVDSPDNAAEISWNFDNGLGIRQKRVELQRSPASDGPSPKGTSAAEGGYFAQRNRSQSPQQDERSPVEIVEDHEEPRASSLTRSSDSTITPPLPPVDVKEHQPEMSLSLPVPQHALMTPDTLTSSAFSSPQFSCGRSSFETPRLGTAASSITDNRTINSLALGEPGPDFRVSVDDVPSLTSSRSTMTSGQQHHLPHFAPRAPGDRSVSVSSASQGIPESRRKRASIASLSKLISGSFNEKSKLSIEQRPQSEHLEPPKELKTKRSKRFSKLVNFWKTNKDQA